LVKALANNGSNWVGVVSTTTITPYGVNTMFRSIDGNNYSQITSGGFDYTANSVAYNGGSEMDKWVAVGRDSAQEHTIQSSTDGINWTPRGNAIDGFPGFPNQGIQVISLGSPVGIEQLRFVAIGDNNEYYSPITASADGIHWSLSVSPPPLGIGESFTINAVAVGFGKIVIVGSGNYPIYYADSEQLPGVTWNSANPEGDNDPHSNILAFANGANTVTYGNSKFIVGGNIAPPAISKYMIQLSDDCSTWGPSTAHNFSTRVNSIISIPTGFVAVGDAATTLNTIQYSADGLTWVPALSGGFTGLEGLNLSLCPGGIIAVGLDTNKLNQIQRSTDGRNWTPITSINGLYGQPTSAGWDGTATLIITSSKGNPPPAPLPTDTIIYSTDSQNWTNASSGGFTDGGYGIMWNSNTSKWYATGKDTIPSFNLQSSTDGLNWGRVTGNTVFGNYWSAIAHNGTTWVGVGSTDSLGMRYTTFTSTDSITWNLVNNGFGTAGNNILWDGTTWWASGDDTLGAQLCGLNTSTNGDTWVPVGAVTSPIIAQIAYNGADYLAVGPNAIWRKRAGTWTKTINSGNYTGVVWNGSLWIVTRSDSTNALANIIYSTDGAYFEVASSGGFTSAYAISYKNLVGPTTVSRTIITSSNLIVNNAPAVPYAGFGTVTSAGPVSITLPYTYSNIPSVVVGHYNAGASYLPTIVYVSSITSSNFSVNARVYNSTWGAPATNVQFTWIATAVTST
jgi:hypothetical protein